MREIKFRAWDLHRKEFLSGGQAIIAIQPGRNPKNIFYLDILKIPDGWKDRFDLQQFTGLKDKNGKEIYEGDILRWKCSKSGSSKVKDYIVTIEWGLHGYQILILDDGRWHTNKSYWNDTDRELIGNIHENPELMEENTNGN
jgi:uncharacterized phage protein (TIGR01671 family)